VASRSRLGMSLTYSGQVENYTFSVNTARTSLLLCSHRPKRLAVCLLRRRTAERTLSRASDYERNCRHRRALLIFCGRSLAASSPRLLARPVAHRRPRRISGKVQPAPPCRGRRPGRSERYLQGATLLFPGVTRRPRRQRPRLCLARRRGPARGRLHGKRGRH
jgi:hypothetical protein